MLNQIIIVDDTELIVKCLKTILLAKGYLRVKTFTDPREAFRHIETAGHPSFMVADFDMPGMNGVELLDAATSLCPGIEGVIITGNRSRLSWLKKYPVIPKDTIDFFDVVVEHIGSRVKPDKTP